mgnify:CR=1 FL=1
MKKILFLFFIFLPFNIFSLDYLIRCERKEKDDLVYLLKKGFKVVDETSYSLFIVIDEKKRIKLDEEFSCEILDENPNNFEYYRIGIKKDSNLSKVEMVGKEIFKEENWVLIKAYPGANFYELQDAKVFIGKLNLQGFKLPKEVEKINLNFQADPIVQKLVSNVSSTQIDNFWNQLTQNSPYGTRYSTSQGCQNAANYSYNQFQSFGLQAQYQNHTTGHAPNVIGTHLGFFNPNIIYIVEGHLDDLPSFGSAPGADDNGSGSVHVLESARVLSCFGLKNTVKFLLLTGEEFGLYGSEYYANNTTEDIRGVINMDMPGWEGDGVPNPENLDLNYNSFSEDLGLLYAQCASLYNTGLVVDAFLCPSLDASDHYPFWQNGYKAICGITDNENYCGHSGSYPYYHTSNDTIWNCGNQSNNHTFFYSTVKATVATIGELSKPFKIILDKASYGCSGQVQIVLADRDLNINPSTQETVQVSIWSSYETNPETVILTENGTNSIYFTGTINLTTNPPQNGDGNLSIQNGSTITARYVDSLDCDGTTNVEYTVNATACTPPIITNVQVSDITPNSAKITWTTNVPSTSRVNYGTSIPPSNYSEDLNNVSSHKITLTGLSPCTNYFFSVSSTDEGGNFAEDNNNGNYYNFSTTGAVYSFGPDDVETQLSGWSLSGQWHRDTCKKHSGNYSFKAGSTSCPGKYNNSTTSNLTWTQDINLGSAGHNYHLRFWEYYDTEAGYDFLRVQISTDGGISWATLGTQYSGQSNGWIQKDYDLSTYSGNVRLRFQFYTDSSLNAEGWYIDDIEISKYVSCAPLIEYQNSNFKDTCNGTGSGGGDGIIDAGEDVNLQITLYNNGATPATGVSATISSTTPGVTITDNFATYPDIASMDSGTSQPNHYSFRVAETVACGTQIDFTINITTNEGNFTDTFSLIVGNVIPGGAIVDFEENFDTVTPPNLPAGWATEVISGNAWVTYNNYSCSSPNQLNYPYNVTQAANSWAYTPGIQLSAGITYTLNFNKRVASSFYPENLEVKVGTAPNSSSQNILIWSQSNITNTTCQLQSPTFTVHEDGTYYIGFHCTSAANKWRMIVDDVQITHPQNPSCNMNPCTSGGACLPDLGDPSENGAISSYDVSLILQYITGLIIFTPSQECKADVNESSSVSAVDGSYTLQCSVGMCSSLPPNFLASCQAHSNCP